MRSFAFKTVLVLAFSALSILSAAAQFGFGSVDPKWVVMMMPEAQKELKLTKDQKKQIQEATKGMQDMAKSGTAGMGMLSDMDAKMLAPLTPEQLTRLEELWIQYEGPSVLTLPEIAAKAKLTDEQQGKVKELWSAYAKSTMDSMMKNPGSMSGIKESRKKHSETNDATLALLTDEQKAAYTALQGALIKWRAKKEM